MSRCIVFTIKHPRWPFPSRNRGFLLAVKFFHKYLLNTDPCKNYIVQNILEVAKRILSHKTKTKKALSFSDLNKIYNNLHQKMTIYKLRRLLTITLIAFYGFLRFSEVSNLHWPNIRFKVRFKKILIHKSKIDVFRGRAIGWIYLCLIMYVMPNNEGLL